MNFFKYYPTVSLVIGGRDVTMTNITTRAKIAARLQSNIVALNDYVIQDGERPDTVAMRVYGDTTLTWVVLMVNNIFTLFDWPLTAEEFDAYITQKYGSTSAAKSRAIYRTVDGYVVDHDTFTALPIASQGTVTTQYDEEVDQNESKRRIKLVPKALVNDLQQELRTLFQ